MATSRHGSEAGDAATGQKAERREDADGAAVAPTRSASPGGSLLGWASSVSPAAVSRRIQRRKAGAHDNDEAEKKSGPAVKWTWRQPSLMTDAQRDAADHARSANHDRFSDDSRRILQLLVGVPPTGDLSYTDLKAIAVFQKAHGRAQPDAIVDEWTLGQLFEAGKAAGRHDQLIHLVARYYDIPLRRRLHSVRFDAALGKDADASSSESGSDFGKVGKPAFASLETLHQAIRKLVAGPEVQSPDVDPSLVPKRLSQDEADRAGLENGNLLRDPRAVRAVQTLLPPGAPVTGRFDGVSAQFLADFQQAHSLEPTGVIDTPTFLALFGELKAMSLFQSAIRLAISYQHLPQAGVLDVAFDPAVPGDFERGDDSGTNRTPQGTPVVLTFGLGAFAGPVEDNLHAIARGLIDVQLTRDPGEKITITERAFREMRFETMSRGMPEEEFGHVDEGFLSDARRALLLWGDLTEQEQGRNWKRFVDLREAVRERFQRAEQWQQAVGASTLADYDKVKEPPRRPPTPARKP